MRRITYNPFSVFAFRKQVSESDFWEIGKYASSVLIFLLEKGQIKKTDLMEIIPSSGTVDRTVKRCQEAGLIEVQEKIVGRKMVYLTLTTKGQVLAQQLKKAEEVAKGEITEERAQFKMPPDWRDRFKGLSAMTHLNVLDDHVAIQEIDHSGKTISVIMVYVKRINSHFELWCEKDESKECRHVDFAWSLPHMRALIEEYIKVGKIKEAGEPR